MKEKIISLIFIFLSFLLIFLTIYKNREFFLEKFNPSYYEQKYYQSQWVIPHSKKPISDEDLYAYAGYQYIHGKNPISINPEVPPLGKYIIGLSIILFNNFRILAVIFALFSLIMIYVITYQITKSPFSSSLAIFLTSINTLFIDQIIHSGQLEIYQLFFILFFIFFLGLYLKSKKFLYLFLAGISFGAFVSIKFFLLFFILINIWLIAFFFIFKHHKNYYISTFKILFFLNFFSLLFFSLTYFQFFQLGGNFKDFLGVQKWIFLFYQQSKIDQLKLIGSHLTLIFMNRWRFWSEGYPILKYESWSIVWPLIFIFGLWSFFKIKNIKQLSYLKKNDYLPLIFSFFIIYNLFLLVVPVYPRYLLLLFFPLNIAVASYLRMVVKI